MLSSLTGVLLTTALDIIFMRVFMWIGALTLVVALLTSYLGMLTSLPAKQKAFQTAKTGQEIYDSYKLAEQMGVGQSANPMDGNDGSSTGSNTVDVSDSDDDDEFMETESANIENPDSETQPDETPPREESPGAYPPQPETPEPQPDTVPQEGTTPSQSGTPTQTAENESGPSETRSDDTVADDADTTASSDSDDDTASDDKNKNTTGTNETGGDESRTDDTRSGGRTSTSENPGSGSVNSDSSSSVGEQREDDSDEEFMEHDEFEDPPDEDGLFDEVSDDIAGVGDDDDTDTVETMGDSSVADMGDEGDVSVSESDVDTSSETESDPDLVENIEYGENMKQDEPDEYVGMTLNAQNADEMFEEALTDAHGEDATVDDITSGFDETKVGNAMEDKITDEYDLTKTDQETHDMKNAVMGRHGVGRRQSLDDLDGDVKFTDSGTESDRGNVDVDDDSTDSKN